MEFLLLFIRIFLFAVFATAAIGKFLDLEGAEKSVKAFGTPADLAKTFAVLIPFAEMVFAVCLLFTSFAWLGAIGVFLFLLIFIGGMISQMAQGNAPDCHCFGAIHSEPVSKKSLIRNIVFALLALVLIAQGRQNQGLSFSEMTQDFAMQFIFGIAILGALGAVIYFLKKISEQQNGIMRRIEVLELISSEGKPVEREDVGNLNEFLPIGAVAPAFALENLSGREISLEKLLASQKSLLVFFVSPSCAPCAALLPEMESWQKDLGERFEFVLISSGKAAENSGKLGTSFKNILLQKGKEVSENYKSIWTPTLLVVNSEGFVASRPAVGDEAIRELIENVKTENEIEYFAPSNGNGTMKIGEDVPEFSLKDLRGKEWTAKDLNNRKTLVTFWSQTCGYCSAMKEELQNWDRTKGADAPDLLILSSGEAEAHKDLQFSSPVLLDEGFQVSTKLGMAGTPSAVLIDENGRIISETASGADKIWILLGEKK